MASTDKELINDFRMNQSRKAFDELFSRHQLSVHRICLGFVANTADAEDLTQEVFVEVFQSLGGFRGEAQFSTWLYRVAVNKSINFLKKKKREKIFQSIEGYFGMGQKGDSPFQLSDQGLSAADKQLDANDLKFALKRAVNGLPENQRVAFVLAKYQDLSYKQIAEVMDITLPSVESLLFRAKANLQKKLLRSR
jgi:RNA polymerase sigma-70 factor (ECF subfamily)